MGIEIKHKVDAAGRQYIEVGRPKLAADMFAKHYDKFAESLVKRLFEQKPNDGDDK